MFIALIDSPSNTFLCRGGFSNFNFQIYSSRERTLRIITQFFSKVAFFLLFLYIPVARKRRISNEKKRRVKPRHCVDAYAMTTNNEPACSIRKKTALTKTKSTKILRRSARTKLIFSDSTVSLGNKQGNPSRSSSAVSSCQRSESAKLSKSESRDSSSESEHLDDEIEAPSESECTKYLTNSSNTMTASANQASDICSYRTESKESPPNMAGRR